MSLTDSHVKRKTRVIVIADCWAKGKHGYLLKFADLANQSAGVTVQLDDGTRFLARRGDVELERR